MARSSGTVAGDLFGESLSQAHVSNETGSIEYSIDRKPSGLVLQFREGDVRGERLLDYFIGSGAVGRSYLFRVDNYLFQAPVSYYSAASKWDISPGYERYTDVNLTRGIETGCLKCHASGLHPAQGTVNSYAIPPFEENGVSCERCHGPAGAHIAAMRAGQAGSASKIVNPARLDRVRRDSVCAQCHLTGVVEIAHAGAPSGFTAGEDFFAGYDVFVWDAPGRPMPVVSHVEKLAQSKCARMSNGRLWCGTCHDPHTVPAAADRVGWYRQRCLTCHSESACKASQTARAKTGDACTQCHMPATEAPSVKHAVFTDHSIPRTPNPVSGSGVPPDAMLIKFGGGEAAVREQGLAWADLALRENNRNWGMRTFGLLQKAYSGHEDDVKVGTQLANLFDRMGNEHRACEIYGHLAGLSEVTAAVRVNLGTCLAKEGRVAESIRLWKLALVQNPALESARLNLAVALMRGGSREEAKAILEDGLRFDPVWRRGRELLGEINSVAR